MRILSGIPVLALGLLSVLPAQAQTYEANGQSTDVKAELSITSLSSDQVIFTFRNVSDIESRLTGIGFDLNGGTFTKTSNAGATTGSGKKKATGDPFVFVNGGDQVPQFNNKASLDFYLAIGGDFNGGGSPQPGLGMGQESFSYTIFSSTNSFSGLSSDDLANGVYFRFKAIDGDGSDVAHRLSAVSVIPEPSEYAFGGMFLASMIGLVVRARRKSAVPTAL